MHMYSILPRPLRKHEFLSTPLLTSFRWVWASNKMERAFIHSIIVMIKMRRTLLYKARARTFEEHFGHTERRQTSWGVNDFDTLKFWARSLLFKLWISDFTSEWVQGVPRSSPFLHTLWADLLIKKRADVYLCLWAWFCTHMCACAQGACVCVRALTYIYFMYASKNEIWHLRDIKKKGA